MIGILLAGFACADQPVPAVPEKQGIVTTTTYNANGIVQEADALAWTLTNLTLNAPPLEPGEIQYTTAYDENILAQAGTTTLVKQMAISTDNKVAATQSNVKASTLLTYVATDDGGNVVGTENILLDGVGNWTKASDRMLCPFASVPDDLIPAYCNIVQMGSSYDLTVGSVTTAASDPFVGTDATVPVDLNYAINVKPYGTTDGSIPAIGSAMAYIKVHVQESRDKNPIYSEFEQRQGIIGYGPGLKSEDLQYSEVTTANGVIQNFNKVMKYQPVRH